MKKLIALTMFAALFCGSVVAQDVTPDDVKKKFNQGADCTGKKDYAGAINAFEEAIALGAKCDQAIETVEQAQKLLPQLYLIHGVSFASKKDYDQALVWFQKSSERAELNGDMMGLNKSKNMISKVYTMLGVAQFNNKAFDKAIEYFSKGYEVNPNDTKLGIYRARSFAESGKIDDAIKAYQEIIALEKRHDKYADDAAAARNELTNNLMFIMSNAAQEGVYEDVEKYADAIFVYDPKNEKALMIKLQAANNAKKYKEVIEFGAAAAAAQSDPVLKSEANFLLGSAYDNLEMNEKAVETYKKVVAGPKVEMASNQADVIAKKLEAEAEQKK